MNHYETIKQQLRSEPRTWLITGVAGFIGSNLLEALLRLDQTVVGLDSLISGSRQNLEEVKATVPAGQWKAFSFHEGDIRDWKTCRQVCRGADYVLHQAALGSVPRSIMDPVGTNQNNVDGFVNMLCAAMDSKARRFIYASSSAVYGDSEELPKVEGHIGTPLSPYALSKRINEQYAEAFATVYGFPSIGLRYFNIFGRRQDPNGPYAAVIPLWFKALLGEKHPVIFGDGETSRDFCHIENCVQANLLAACTDNPEALGEVYNVALGQRTTLKELLELIRERVAPVKPSAASPQPVFKDFRPGDVRHSLADISKARELLGFDPHVSVNQGLDLARDWYVGTFAENNVLKYEDLSSLHSR